MRRDCKSVHRSGPNGGSVGGRGGVTTSQFGRWQAGLAGGVAGVTCTLAPPGWVTLRGRADHGQRNAFKFRTFKFPPREASEGDARDRKGNRNPGEKCLGALFQ